MTDGRNIDPGTGSLGGEAGDQRAYGSEGQIASLWTQLPVPSHDDPTYYDRPLLKAPVWKLYIPAYYFVGGAAGASLALGAAAQLDGSEDLNKLVQRCHWIGIIGSSLGGLLLVADLGRPERFLYMLRVFRPTSPMNMGAWILAVAPSAALTAGLFARRSPIWPSSKRRVCPPSLSLGSRAESNANGSRLFSGARRRSQGPSRPPTQSSLSSLSQVPSM